MTRGFLLIDPKMNTLILPLDDPDLVEFMRNKPGYPKSIDRAHVHKTRKELNDDVKAYLKGEYDG